MPIAMQCDQCGFSRTVPDEYAGKQGKCPKCGAVVRVPQPGTAAAPTKTTPVSKDVTIQKPTAKAPVSSRVAPVAKRLTPAPMSSAPRSQPAAPKPEPVEEVAESNATLYGDTEAPASEPADDTSWTDMVTSSSATTPSSRSRRSTSGKRSPARKPAKEDANEQDPSPRRRQKQTSSLPIPMWAIAAILGGVLLAVGGGVYFALSSGEKPVAKAKKSTKSKNKSRNDDPKGVLDTGATGKMKSPEELGIVKKTPELQRPPAGAPLTDVFTWVKPGIVVIEVFSGGQQIGMGSGFVVDPTGVIVTNYHVSSPGDAAYVKFTDESRYEVSGYLAVKPEWDLAILQLKDKPANLRVLNLVHDKKPQEASEVMAVGSPLGHTFVPTKGIVGRVVQATDLPPSARGFVLRYTGQDEQFWIEHDAKIAPGNSGGPLFNMAGDVVGVNSWVDGQVNFGYAIWSWYVHDLLSKKLPSVAPLAQYKKVDVSPSARLVGGEVTVETLQKLYDEGAAMKWSPKDGAQYGRLQELAKVLAVGRYADRMGLPKEVSAKAVELSGKLAGAAWTVADNVEPVNKLATPELSKPMTGTMLFATIKSKQTGQSQAGQITLLVLTIEGTNEIVAVPVTGVEAAFKEGTSCLLFGIVSTNKIVYATPSEGRIEASVLEAPVVLPIKKS